MTNVSPFPAAIREPPPTMPAIPDIPKQTILDFLKAFGLASQLTETEKLQFIEVAQAFRLNPFRREVHCVVYGEGENRRMSIVVGYEVYLKRAERTGKLDGWSTRIEGEGENMKAIVEIHRKDWSEPFVMLEFGPRIHRPARPQFPRPRLAPQARQRGQARRACVIGSVAEWNLPHAARTDHC